MPNSGINPLESWHPSQRVRSVARSYIITGNGALRRDAWTYQTERTRSGRERELNRAVVPGQLSFITGRVCSGKLHRYITPRDLRHRLGGELFDQAVQAGWTDQGGPERTGNCHISDFALF